MTAEVAWVTSLSGAFLLFMAYTIGHLRGHDAGIRSQKEVTNIVTQRADAAEQASHVWKTVQRPEEL